MVAQAESQGPDRPKPPKRRLRNYLLDSRFQLKYTGMVVVVTTVVAMALGAFAYRFSKGQTESMTVSIAANPQLNPEAAEDLAAYADAEDQKVLMGIVLGILVLAFALGATGIVVTHKVVGPAYKMKLLLMEVAEGKLKLAGRLRKGDELQELFEAFAVMVEGLRENQGREIAELSAAIEKARAAGVDEEALQGFSEVHDRMKAALD